MVDLNISSEHRTFPGEKSASLCLPGQNTALKIDSELLKGEKHSEENHVDLVLEFVQVIFGLKGPRMIFLLA